MRVKEDYFLKLEDVLEIFLADDSIDALSKPIETVIPEKIGLDIVFENESLLVVNKPKGMLTHPDKEEYKNTLATIVQFYLRELCTNTFKPAPIHRLDKNTSGLVIFAKTYEALKHYNARMRERDIKKYYVCVVEGVVKKPGEVKGYLIKDERSNTVRIVAHDTDQAKFCHTKYRPLKTYRDYTLMEIDLITGRSHQIRASMQTIGHSIVGDQKYGGKKIKDIENQLLHSHKLILDDWVFEAPSKEIEQFLSELR